MNKDDFWGLFITFLLLLIFDFDEIFENITIPDGNWTVPDYNYTIPDGNWTVPDYNYTIPTYNNTGNWSIPYYNYTIPDYNNTIQLLLYINKSLIISIM